MGAVDRSCSSRWPIVALGKATRIGLVALFMAATSVVFAAVTTNVAAANQTDWSAPQDIDGNTLLTSVSSASSQFCVAGVNSDHRACKGHDHHGICGSDFHKRHVTGLVINRGERRGGPTGRGGGRCAERVSRQ